MRKLTILLSLVLLILSTATANAGQGPKSRTMEKASHSFHTISVGWGEGGATEFGGYDHNGELTFQLMEDGLYVWFTDNYYENGFWCGPGDDEVEFTDDDWYGDAWHNLSFDGGNGPVEGGLELLGRRSADGAHAWALIFVGGSEGACDEGYDFEGRPMLVEVWMDPSDTAVRERNATFVRSPDGSSQHSYSFTGREGSGSVTFIDVYFEGEDWFEMRDEFGDPTGFFEGLDVYGRFGEAKDDSMTKS